jgi:hypothetical protein
MPVEARAGAAAPRIGAVAGPSGRRRPRQDAADQAVERRVVHVHRDATTRGRSRGRNGGRRHHDCSEAIATPGSLRVSPTYRVFPVKHLAVRPRRGDAPARAVTVRRHAPCVSMRKSDGRQAHRAHWFEPAQRWTTSGATSRSERAIATGVAEGGDSMSAPFLAFSLGGRRCSCRADARWLAEHPRHAAQRATEAEATPHRRSAGSAHGTLTTASASVGHTDMCCPEPARVQSRAKTTSFVLRAYAQCRPSWRAACPRVGATRARERGWRRSCDRRNAGRDPASAQVDNRVVVRNGGCR